MKIKWPKIDWSIVVEVVGVALATYGLYMIAPAISFIALGSFLIWATERK